MAMGGAKGKAVAADAWALATAVCGLATGLCGVTTGKSTVDWRELSLSSRVSIILAFRFLEPFWVPFSSAAEKREWELSPPAAARVEVYTTFLFTLAHVAGPRGRVE